MSIPFNLITLDKMPNVKNILSLEFLKQNIKSKQNDNIKSYLDTNDKPEIYFELLPIAIFHQNFEIIKYIVEKFNIKNTFSLNMNASSFYNSILQDDSPDKITEGKEIYIDVQVPFVLMSGIGGDIEIFKYLLNHKLISNKNQTGIIGLSKKFKNIFNSNIIGACAYYGKNKLLEYLLKNYKNDLDVNVVTTEKKSKNTKFNILKEIQGCTPCLLAIEGPSSDTTTLETLKILNNYRANFGVNDFNEDNILHLATKAKKIETAKYIIDILKLKDLINEVNKEKYTPLSLAQHLNNDIFITYYSDINEIDEKEIQDNLNELIESSKTTTNKISKKSKKKNKKKGKNRDMPSLLKFSSENKESLEDEKNKKKEESNNNKNELQKEINSRKNEESQDIKSDINEKNVKKEEEIKEKNEEKDNQIKEESEKETKKGETKNEIKKEESKKETKKEKKENANKKSKKIVNIQTTEQQEDEFVIGLNVKKNKKNKKLKKENNDSPNKEKENEENKKEEKTNENNNKSEKLKNKSKKEKRVDKEEEEIKKKEEEKRRKEEEEKRRKDEEEKRRKEEEEEKKKKEEERKRKEEEKKRKEEEKRKKEEEENRRKEEEEKKRKKEEEKRKKEEEERKRKEEEENKRKEEEEKRKKEEEENKRKEEEEKSKKEEVEEKVFSVSEDDNIEDFSSKKYEDNIQVDEKDYDKLNQKYIELGKKIENSEKEKAHLISLLSEIYKKNKEKTNNEQDINDLIYLSNKELEDKNLIIDELEEKKSMLDLKDINNFSKEKLEKYKEFYTKNLKLIDDLMK